ncbi:MAG TPA: sigma-70 family RNA polymerase sigma factor [Acidobacteriaceae bacterium]|nr:sigma-70 family RNA polymerase sigma factor [Acidobacteriaceae bacterium]
MHETPSNPNVQSPRSLNRTAEGASVEDLALLHQIQAGSQDAMAAFFDRYSKMVYSVALRVLNDSSEAEDVMQEVLLQVWRNPGAFVAGRGSLGGWLVVVTRNRAVDKLRRRKISDPIELFALPSSTNLEQESERALLMEKVQTAMHTLPVEQKSALELSFFEGLSHTEIAKKTGEPLGTIKARIRLGLMAIRKGLAV